MSKKKKKLKRQLIFAKKNKMVTTVYTKLKYHLKVKDASLLCNEENVDLAKL